MADRPETALTAPGLVGAWLNLGWIRSMSEEPGQAENAWTANAISLASTRNPDIAAQRDAATASIVRVASDIPAGAARYVLMAAPFDDPSVVTFTLVRLAEPAPRGVVRQEQVTEGGWVLRFPRSALAIGAVSTGALPAEDRLRELFGAVGIDEAKKRGTLGAVVDFVDFWSFGGRA